MLPKSAQLVMPPTAKEKCPISVSGLQHSYHCCVHSFAEIELRLEAVKYQELIWAEASLISKTCTGKKVTTYVQTSFLQTYTVAPSPATEIIYNTDNPTWKTRKSALPLISYCAPAHYWSLHHTMVMQKYSFKSRDALAQGRWQCSCEIPHSARRAQISVAEQCHWAVQESTIPSSEIPGIDNVGVGVLQLECTDLWKMVAVPLSGLSWLFLSSLATRSCKPARKVAQELWGLEQALALSREDKGKLLAPLSSLYICSGMWLQSCRSVYLLTHLERRKRHIKFPLKCQQNKKIIIKKTTAEIRLCWEPETELDAALSVQPVKQQVASSCPLPMVSPRTAGGILPCAASHLLWDNWELHKMQGVLKGLK